MTNTIPCPHPDKCGVTSHISGSQSHGRCLLFNVAQPLTQSDVKSPNIMPVSTERDTVIKGREASRKLIDFYKILAPIYKGYKKNDDSRGEIDYDGQRYKYILRNCDKFSSRKSFMVETMFEGISYKDEFIARDNDEWSPNYTYREVSMTENGLKFSLSFWGEDDYMLFTVKDANIKEWSEPIFSEQYNGEGWYSGEQHATQYKDIFDKLTDALCYEDSYSFTH